ncbi:MAG: hypothetical protein RR428_06560 [Coprobacillus sp.]
MKKKIIISIVVLLVLLGLGGFVNFPVYGFVSDIHIENEKISFNVLGAGNGFYAGYNVYEKEQGTYVFQMYSQIFPGERYLKEIVIDNKDKRIQKLIQPTIDGNDYEVIYEYEKGIPIQ